MGKEMEEEDVMKTLKMLMKGKDHGVPWWRILDEAGAAISERTAQNENITIESPTETQGLKPTVRSVNFVKNGWLEELVSSSTATTAKKPLTIEEEKEKLAEFHERLTRLGIKAEVKGSKVKKPEPKNRVEDTKGKGKTGEQKPKRESIIERQLKTLKE